MPEDLKEETSQPLPLSSTVAPKHELSAIVIALLKGVVYQEDDAHLWNSLIRLQTRVRDYIAVLGLKLVLDEAEGHAFCQSSIADDDLSEAKIPRLVVRRPLSFPVSLLLALLRKKLAEFDARGGDTLLVLSYHEIVNLLSVFLPRGSNETRLFAQVSSYINKIVELGFLRRLRVTASAREDSFVVRRILKSYVDAQWLADLDLRLDEYKAKLASAIEDVDYD